MASSGKLIFLAIVDCIKVYEAADFSSRNPPDPSTFFPFNPITSLRATPQQQRKIISRIPTAGATDRNSDIPIILNHIRTGYIGDQESLVAVGEYGCILVWNLAELGREEPVLMESSDFASTWGIAMSRNNFLLATSSNSHAVTIFHFPSGRVIFSLEQQRNLTAQETLEITQIHKHNIPSLDFSPCGKFLASCSIDGQVFLWSLAKNEIIRIKSSSMEWGWLVRFVPSQQYDLRTSIGKYTKSFYNSSIEESHFHETPINYIINQNSLEEYDSDLEGSDDMAAYSNFIGDNFSNTEGVHLAEGAGETWPSESEAEEILDNRRYSDYYDTGSADDNSDNGSDHDYNIEDSNWTEIVDSIKINFLNTDDIILFKPLAPPIPFDLFYCSSESISVYDSSSKLKLHIPKLKNICSKRQNSEPSNQYLYGMEFLQNRLAMGEWIFELGIFIVINCNGQVFISSPKQNNNLPSSLDFNTIIMLPESFNESSPIIGYTLIKQYDEEYGDKFHLYIICENG